MDNQKDKVLAIDGPSGSGKSTVTQQVAATLGMLYVDTGAMFRALGLVAHQEKISLTDHSALSHWLSKLHFAYGQSKEALIVINGVNLTSAIREHSVSQMASTISKIPLVRTYLLERQRELVSHQFCTMEGRDIGTVVFPKSFCKIFLTAVPEVRAKRRYSELVEKDPSLTFERVLSDIIERDRQDSEREVAPLKQAHDAFLLDTSSLNPHQVVAHIVDYAQSCRKQSFGDLFFPISETKEK